MRSLDKTTDVRELTTDEMDMVCGGETPTQTHNRAMTDVLGGAATGAVAGALAGSIAPGVGTVAGAVVGGLGGMFAGAVKFVVVTIATKPTQPKETEAQQTG